MSRCPTLEARLRRPAGLGAAAGRSLRPGRYEVILPPDAVADLVIEIAGATGGQDAEDGGTRLLRRERAAPRRRELSFDLPFRLWSDPAFPGSRVRPVPPRRRIVLEPTFRCSTTVADRPGLMDRRGRAPPPPLPPCRRRRSQVPFAPPIDNLVLELPGANGDLESSSRRTERGLLLTCLWYIREVDPQTLLLTGLTRDGVYLVEHGEITGAVNNFRFNESPLNMLANVLEAGRTERALFP